MTPLVIVPARAGSVGVPNKNFAPLPDGTTLLSRAVAIGQQIGEVMVSTDAAAAALACLPSAQLPGLGVIGRPAALAQDDTPMRDVVEHVLANVPGPPEQPIVLLQPTTPFRTVLEVRTCVDMMCEFGTPAATVRAIPSRYWRAAPLAPYLFLPKIRRQDATEQVMFSGEAYVFPRAWGLNPANSFRVVLLDSEPHVNVDSPADWEALCEIIRSRMA
jgi:CMP-N-acetylneuraminic acid synthetase